ncbi:MAG TPA: choice-of-anchor L domain-containing protein [Cytophagaceae bacterium]|jgi:hypothetical protein
MKNIFKYIILSICVGFKAGVLFGQLTVDNTKTPQQLIASLVGQGITVSNISFEGNPLSSGSFNGVSSNLGLNSGIILTTGESSSAAAKSSSKGQWSFTEIDNPALKSLGPQKALFDGSGLTFDFIPCTDHIRVRFVFGSDDYNEYVNGSFDDVLGFFITSKGNDGLNYINRNIALVPGTSLPVNVNNVNNGLADGSTVPTGPCTNCEFFKENVSNSASRTVQYDGLTIPMVAEIAVTPGQLYSMQIAIADAGDPTYDSGIFLESGSFIAVPPVATASKVCLGTTLNLTASGGGLAYSWTGPNGFTSTLQNPSLTNATGATAGTYFAKVTYAVGCEITTNVNVPVQSSSCCGNVLRKVIGATGKATAFSGGATFSGAYIVNGDLEFNAGTYNFSPNTAFYFKNNTGVKVGADGIVNLEGATLTSSCAAVWNGVELTGNGKVYTTASKTSTGTIIKRSEISNCKSALSFTNSSVPNLPIYYGIDNTDFLNVFANCIESNQFSNCASCSVSNSSFKVDPFYLKSMYSTAYPNGSFSGDRYLGNGAICYSGSSTLTVTNSTFDNLLYGIYSPASSGNLVASGNSATNVYRSFIKTPTLYGGTIYSNSIVLPTKQFISSQANLTSPTGIEIDGSSVIIYDNSISADEPNPQEMLTGINISDGMLSSSNKVYQNTLSYLGVGIGLIIRNSMGAGLDVYNNIINANKRGVVIRQLIDDPRQGNANIFCNRFANPARMPGLQGIVVETDRLLNNQGSAGNPAGNRFIDIATPLVNLAGNAPFIYFYGTNEVSPATSGAVILSPASVASACSTRGYANGNGREEAGGTLDRDALADYLSELSPNPAKDLVSFFVRVPANATDAKIMIYSATDGKVGELNVSPSEAQAHRTDVSEYTPGLYFYSLLIDGEVVSSKKLMVVR